MYKMLFLHIITVGFDIYAYVGSEIETLAGHALS